MAVLPAFFGFLLFNSISGQILRDDVGLLWPSEYHFKGQEINFLAKLAKPFEIWYSSSINRSRCDYYDGMEKIYYYGDSGQILNVHPITDRLLEPMTACMKRYTADPYEDFMPDASKLVYTDTVTYRDQEVEQWEYEEIEANIIKTVVAVYVSKTKNEEHILLRQERREYNLNSGALTSHVLTEYFDFADTFSELKLSYEDSENCVTTSSDDSVGIGEFLSTQVLDTAFHSYTRHHNKSYNEDEHNIRKKIFEKNLRKVQEVNKQNLGYKLTLNQFSDQTKEELRYLTGTRPSDHPQINASPFPHTLEEIDQFAEELPESFDLRMEGVITPVKDQGQCASCWSFATTAAVEGAIARSTGGKLVDLSEQSLIDCAWGYRNKGCNSGTLDGAMAYVAQYGIPTDADYGDYKGEDGTCDLLDMTSTYQIRGFVAVTPRHPNALKLALIKYGPVAVSLHVSDAMFQYSNGIYYDFQCEGKSVNHGVTVVGYGVRDGSEYWIIKNSWGEIWGEGGYILMSTKNNNCFVQDSPYYPII